MKRTILTSSTWTTVMMSAAERPIVTSVIYSSKLWHFIMKYLDVTFGQHLFIFILRFLKLCHTE